MKAFKLINTQYALYNFLDKVVFGSEENKIERKQRAERKGNDSYSSFFVIINVVSLAYLKYLLNRTII